jgi:DNA-directed RNA polymerase specialized sigma24 family protein
LKVRQHDEYESTYNLRGVLEVTVKRLFLNKEKVDAKHDQFIEFDGEDAVMEPALITQPAQEHALDLRVVQEAVRDLPDSQREAVMLDSHGFTNEEIATLTGRNLNTAASDVRRGRAALKALQLV